MFCITVDTFANCAVNPLMVEDKSSNILPMPDANPFPALGSFKKFKDEKLVIYAYNAGEGVVLEWLKVGNLSNFPYKETKNYYQKVKRTKKIYSTLYKI